MSEILEELDEQIKGNPRGVLFYLKITLLFFVVVFFGIYVGNLLFGKSSLDVLLNLQSDKEVLEKKVSDLKEQNAILQKEYFELKGLDPDSKGR
ncbi:MAG TPA: septum formation initiator [Sulfurospirillum sp. UBA12182]|jgi:cell division protein FtsB|nr:MAG TPA: septum formation initiator [Sulfurospirillum sp. UBA12182]